ncbi:unnamed protein product [Mytilus edulis]|uniref:Uncharacterized protein n=1 Tax=Mytilus edulis TaxID=6550 RepID=A0A8S3UKR2_MYTED|nr:unnamed protein product [Mytilus edulis]
MQGLNILNSIVSQGKSVSIESLGYIDNFDDSDNDPDYNLTTEHSSDSKSSGNNGEPTERKLKTLKSVRKRTARATATKEKNRFKANSFKHKLKESVDLGGPRKDFFVVALREMKDQYFNYIREWSKDYAVLGKIMGNYVNAKTVYSVLQYNRSRGRVLQHTQEYANGSLSIWTICSEYKYSRQKEERRGYRNKKIKNNEALNESMIETREEHLLRKIIIAAAKKMAVKPSPSKGNANMSFLPGLNVQQYHQKEVLKATKPTGQEESIAINKDSIVNLKSRIFVRQRRKNPNDRCKEMVENNIENEMPTKKGKGRRRRGQNKFNFSSE